jgi:hypothetical protein
LSDFVGWTRGGIAGEGADGLPTPAGLHDAKRTEMMRLVKSLFVLLPEKSST